MRLRHRPLVGGDDLLAGGALAPVELDHLGGGVAGLHHDKALRTAELHQEVASFALLRA